MHPKLKDILKSNPLASFFVDKRMEVFRNDGDRPRPTGLRAQDIVGTFPKNTYTVTMRRDGKVLRLGPARGPDIPALHQAILVDTVGPFYVTSNGKTATLSLRSTTSYKLSLGTVRQLTGRAPVFREIVPITRDAIVAYIVKQMYGLEI